MDDAGARFNDGYARAVADEVDQRFAAAWNDDVDCLAGIKQLFDCWACRGQQSDDSLRNLMGVKNIVNDGDDRLIRVFGIASAF